MEEPPPVADDDPGCTFVQCFCRWRRLCSSRIPQVVPGRDYERVPPAAVDRAAWSLLIDFASTSTGRSQLRLSRFRVAPSGRILGRSDDALEILDGGFGYEAKSVSALVMSAGAMTPIPDDGHSLSLGLFFRIPGREPASPLAVELHLDLAAGGRITASPLPELQQGPLLPTRPISAAGHLWAPYFARQNDQCPGFTLPWVEVAAVDSPHWKQESYRCIIHGYAVVGDTILLSTHPSHLFFVFHCSTCAFAEVITSETKKFYYFPILVRGLYVEQDDTIYFLRDSVVFAYKLCRDDQNQNEYRMAPPTTVDCVCPFGDEGCAFLTHLGGRVLCYVWISSPFSRRRSKLLCNCDTSHVLITTFRVKGVKSDNGSKPFVPKGVQVLHSTCRRLNISSDCRFCFLQEYEEFSHEDAMHPAKRRREDAMSHSMLEWMEVSASSNVLESSKMLTCCRKFLNDPPFLNVLMLEGSVIQIKKAIYIICQVPSRSTVYEISILDGRLTCHNKTLTPHCVMETFVCHDPYDLMERPLSWHFVCDNTFVYAVPHKRDEMYVCDLDAGTIDLLNARRPFGDEFSISLALQAGHKIIAISDTLGGVYHFRDAQEWEHLSSIGSAESVDLERKVNLSGYVVLSDESFMVSDAETCCCYLFDLRNDTWSVVKPYAGVTSSPPVTIYMYGWGSLHGRSVLAEGFIYTCANEGIVAYEIDEVEDSSCLGCQIYLKIPWRKFWEADRMCLDYVGKDRISGDIMFCLVQGSEYCPLPGAPRYHPVSITTIQVKTERMANGKLKPVEIGYVDIGTSFVEQDGGLIWTNNCFAVAR
ncbi:hypothetical protein ACP70R_005686 [Stipagrostis hirtigluma subsp. patula]